jgi:hypothetical protein
MVVGTAHGAVIDFRSDAQSVIKVADRAYMLNGVGAVLPDVAGLDVYNPANGFRDVDFLFVPHEAWLRYSGGKLVADAAAEWISTSPNGAGYFESGFNPPGENSGLYAIRIRSDFDTFVGAELTFTYAADNYILAMYLNNDDTALTADNGAYIMNTYAFGEQTLVFSNLTINKGENWLFVYLANDHQDCPGPAGLIYTGSLTMPGARIPEPVSMSLLAVGAMGMLIRRKR